MQNQVVIEYRWDESMRTGDDRVDAQHQELIRQLNLLIGAMSRGEAGAQLQPILKFLAEYAVKHFGHEEHCMDEYRCPAAQANKTAHALFLQKFTAFRQQVETHSGSDSLIAIQLLRELSDWLVNHIRRVDAQLLPCIKGTK